MIKKILLALLLLIVLFLTIIGILMWKELGQSPKGERLARIQQSPNYKNGAFQNDPPSKMFTSGDSSQKRERPSGRVEKAPSKPLPAIKTDLKTLNRDKDLVIWFGHSSVLIQQDGIRYLIDPVFDSRFPLSLAINPYKGTDIYTPEDIPDIDYLIITHDHWDHLDYKTVLELKDRVKSVVCGLGVGQHFEYWGYPPEKIHELDWGESLDINKNTKLYALEARHFSGRLSGNPTLWASFMIAGPRKIYISGDTGFGDHFQKISEQFKSIDFAIMENGQYNDAWNQVHLMPDGLVKAIDILSPKYVMTYHHAKFTLSRHSWYEPIENIYQSSKDKPYHLLTPVIGDIIDLNAPKNTEPWWSPYREEIQITN